MSSLESASSASVDDLKAVSSPNRREILLSLKERRMTLTELSGKLGIKPSSSKQHLDVLGLGGFVRLVDEGRKWKYYELTDKGRNLFSAGNKRISLFVVFASSLVLLVSIALLYNSFSLLSSTGMQKLALSSAAEAGVRETKALPASDNAIVSSGGSPAGETVSCVQKGIDLQSIVLVSAALASSFVLGYSFAVMIGNRAGKAQSL